ncbi:hypothetical protein VNI00_011758 [Paramarasmius palmivorus]|uniref:RanBD1 domain-containing protein n=1 Tax=Paramarasmius palmivorus TaxID=297713 RepID=A0AAW0C7K4_9AGAR
MKRVADRQLTKDDGDEEDDEVQEQGVFRKADDATMAGRQIRGLPRRAQKTASNSSITSNASTEPDSNETPAAASKFGGFGGFGGFGSKSSGNSFTFTPPAQSSSSSSPFGSKSDAAAPPVTSTTASSTAKAFSSFLGNTSSDNAPATTPKTAPLSQQPTVPNIESSSHSNNDSVAVHYYTQLRGLNVSFVSTIQKAVDDDPFVDIGGLLESYKSLRLNVQREYDEKKKTTPPTVKSAMPTPPSSFSGFGNFSNSSKAPVTSSGSGSGGFTPVIDSSKASASSPFSFPTGAPSSSTAPSTSLPFSLTKPSDTTSGAETSSAAPSTGFFKPSTASTTNSLFGTKPAESSSSSKLGPSPFTFGSSAAASSPFGGFGSPDKTSSSTPSTPPASKGGFGGFGASNGFGKTSPGGGSIGNPVGFGFGAAGGSTSTSSNPFGAPASGSAFGSGGFSFKPATATKAVEEEATDGEDSGSGSGSQSQSQEGSGEVATGMFGANPHDEEGEGEEEEDTVHSVKSKVYRMKKEGDKTGWADLGTGILRVKKHKTTGSRRLLLRNSSNGKININFALYAGLKPNLSAKSLTFVGHEAGTAQTYNVRVKTEEQARELKEVLDREIAFVKAKSSD